MQYVGQSVELGATVRIFAARRWFDERMNMIGHHAGRVEVITLLGFTVEKGVEYELAGVGREFLAFVRGEREMVFGPGAFEMGEAAFGIANVGCGRRDG